MEQEKSSGRLGKLAERRNNVEKLYYEEGQEISKIAKALNSNKTQIKQDIKAIRDKKSDNDECMQIGSEIYFYKNNRFNFNSQEENIMQRKLDLYIAHCEKELKNHTLKIGEMPKINQARMITLIYQHFVFYIRACIKFGMIEEAKKAVDNCKGATEKQTNELETLSQEIEIAQKKYMKKNNNKEKEI